MVEYKKDRLDLVFHALSDKTRRKMLDRLAKKECNVTDLAKPFDMSLAAISKHLKVLEKACLVKRTKEGRVHRLVMDPAPLKAVSEVVQHYEKFWQKQLESLDTYLINLKE